MGFFSGIWDAVKSFGHMLLDPIFDIAKQIPIIGEVAGLVEGAIGTISDMIDMPVGILDSTIGGFIPDVFGDLTNGIFGETTDTSSSLFG